MGAQDVFSGPPRSISPFRSIKTIQPSLNVPRQFAAASSELALAQIVMFVLALAASDPAEPKAGMQIIGGARKLSVSRELAEIRHAETTRITPMTSSVIISS